MVRNSGVRKSFVACALARKACRDGYSALVPNRCSAGMRATATASSGLHV